MLNLRKLDGYFQLKRTSLLSSLLGVAPAGRVWDQATLQENSGPNGVPLQTHSRKEFIHALSLVWAAEKKAILSARSHLFSTETPQEDRKTIEDASNNSLLTFESEKPLITLLTSGTIGEAKAHDKNARQLFSETLALVNFLALNSSDTVLATTPIHHVYGLLFSLLAPWAAGAKIVADKRNEPENFHPLQIAQLVRHHRVTRLILVPAHLRAILEAKPNLGDLKQVVCSAAPLAQEDAQAFEKQFHVEVLDVLGSTETGGIATRRSALSTRWLPLPGVRVNVRADQRVLLSSPFLSIPDQAVLTEERGIVHADGSFEYLGRADNIVKVGGKRIDLEEVSCYARQIKGVTDALTLSHAVDSLRGCEIWLVVAGRDLDRKSIREGLRAQLPPTFVPRRIRIVERLPLDERGKISKANALKLFSTEEKGRDAL